MPGMKNCVAIIGIASRFPGSDNIHEYWKSLSNGENHIKEITPDRWNVDAFYDESGDAPGKTYIRHAGLLDRVYDWDNQLFGINEIEAERIDPQQKLALEIAYQAIENAGLTKEKLKGTDTAVYMGHMNDDFPKLASFDPSYADSLTATGTSGSVISNRISYLFDVHGPSLTVDTACSSSLVCLHLGAKSILSGECGMAICGGVNLILYPGATICLSKAKMASRTGQCRAFAEDADGYVRGEGCGVVIIKSVERAIQDRDRIWGYITTGCNSDGQDSVPMTNPSLNRQKILIEETIKKAGIDPTEVQYVEMHGTGTPVGDPTEASAVGQVYGKARKQKQLSKLPIGSVKTNIGHLESTAGMAGLFKLILMLKYQHLAPTLWCDTQSTKIDFDDLHIDVVKHLVGWPEVKGYVTYGAVNSFGFGGTNVHAIVEGSLQREPKKQLVVEQRMACFSGMSSESLLKTMQDTQAWIKSGEIKDFDRLSETSIFARNHFLYRQAIVSSSLNELEQELKKKCQAEKVGVKAFRKNIPRRLIFVFCGTGTHWDKMGVELYEQHTVFKSSIDKVDKIFAPLAGFTIKDCLYGKHNLGNPVYGQPAIFGVQVGLVRLWEYYGITPNAVIGHSLGEVSAAYGSKKLCLESAVKVVCSRLEHLKKVSGGGMLVIGNVKTEDIEKVIQEKGLQKQMCVAAYNTGTSCTLSGDSQELYLLQADLAERYKAQGIFLRKLPVSTAYHSHFLDSVLNDLEKSLPTLTGTDSKENIQLYSTVTGKLESEETVLKKMHWVHNARKPVLFMQGLHAALMENGKNIVVEIGPKPDLRSAIRNIGKDLDYDIFLVPSMTENDSVNTFFTSLGKMYEIGEDVKGTQKTTVGDFPRYGLVKKNHFRVPKNTEFLRGELMKHFFHPLVSTDTDMEGLVSLTRVTPFAAKFVYDHIFFSKIVIPGAIYVEAVAATCEQFCIVDFSCGNMLEMSVAFQKGYLLKSDTSTAVLKTTLFPVEATADGNCYKEWEFDVTSPDALHASGSVRITSSKHGQKEHDIRGIMRRCPSQFTPDDLYGQLASGGFQHGSLLKGVTSGRRNNTEVIATIHIDDQNVSAYVIHPVMFDCILQLVAMVRVPGLDAVTKVPVGVNKLQIFNKPTSNVTVHLYIDEIKDRTAIINAVVMNMDGKEVLKFQGIKTIIPGEEDSMPLRDMMYHLTWDDLDLTKIENRSEDKILLLSNFSKKIMTQFKEAGLGHHIVTCDTKVKNDILNDGESILRYFPEDMSQYSHILYCWGAVNRLDEEASGLKISDRIGEVCYLLLQLILVIQKKYPKMTINIITSSTYHILNGLPKDDKSMIDGCIGTSIWGMMRSVLKEVPFQHYRCIDITPFTNTHIALLKQVIHSDMDEAEITITDDRVISCCLMPITPNVYNKERFLQVPPSTKICLDPVSENDNSIVGTVVSKKYGSGVQNNGHYMHVKAAFVVSTKPNLVPHLSENGSHSSPLMSFGSICEINSKQYHSLKVESVTNKTEFNRTFAIPATVFPSSTPSIYLWFTAWHFVKGCIRYIPKVTLLKITSVIQDQLLSAVVNKVFQFNGYITDVQGSTINEQCCSVILALNAEDVNTLIEVEVLKTSPATFILTSSKGNIEKISKFADILGQSSMFREKVEFITTDSLLLQKEFESSVQQFDKWLTKLNKQKLKIAVDEIDGLITNNIPVTTYLQHAKRIDGACIIEMPQKNEVFARASENALFRGDSSYLVIGGSKGLGFEIVKHLATGGAGYIGILSRTGMTEDKIDILKDLQKENKFQFLNLMADVSNYDQMEFAITQMKNTFHSAQIRGVFFGVILLDNSIMPNMTLQKFNRVLRPKVVGAWNVHNIFKTTDLDYFIVHSSIASMIGSPGQTNYSAANAFTDAIACFRRHSVGAGQSICWGALQLGVLEDNEEARRKIARYGMYSLSPKETMKILDHCLLYNPTLIMCTKLNWVLISKGVPGNSSMERVMTRVMQRKAHFVRRHTGNANTQVTTAKDFDRVVTELLKTVMMLDDDELNFDDTLDMLGIDSQQITVIYSTLVDTLGEIPISPLDIPGLTVRELLDKLQSVTDLEKEDREQVDEIDGDLEEQKAIVKQEVIKMDKDAVAIKAPGRTEHHQTTQKEDIEKMPSQNNASFSKMLDGEYFYDDDDNEIVLKVDRRSQKDFFLVATDSDDTKSLDLKIHLISQIAITGEDEMEPCLIITTNKGKKYTFKSDNEHGQLSMWKIGLQTIIDESKRYTDVPEHAKNVSNGAVKSHNVMNGHGAIHGQTNEAKSSKTCTLL